MSWMIQVENLGKKYRRGDSPILSINFRETLVEKCKALIPFVRSARKASDEQENDFWALDGLDFEIREGELVGIIGRNGAGKSTLLKVLSRVTPPSRGGFRHRGRLASLLEIGTGFHSQLTGRENIFLNGAILGLRRAEIRAKFDAIVEFAGVGSFLDTPVRFYSSGMYVRLAFAIAAHLETDILLIDEVLAVGDAEFQKRCTRRMDDVAQGGRTVLFVSHNMGLIQHHCSRGIVLERGKIRYDGSVHEAVHKYLSGLNVVGKRYDYPDSYPRRGSGAYRVRSIRFSHATMDLPQLVCGQGGRITMRLEVPAERLPVHGAAISLSFYSLDGTRVANLWSKAVCGELTLDRSDMEVEIMIPRVPFCRGEYHLEIWASIYSQPCDWIDDAGAVEVVEGDFFSMGVSSYENQGVVFCDHSWRLVG